MQRVLSAQAMATSGKASFAGGRSCLRLERFQAEEAQAAAREYFAVGRMVSGAGSPRFGRWNSSRCSNAVDLKNGKRCDDLFHVRFAIRLAEEAGTLTLA